MPPTRPIETRAVGDTRSCSNAYRRKNPTANTTSTMPAYKRRRSPMRRSSEPSKTESNGEGSEDGGDGGTGYGPREPGSRGGLGGGARRAGVSGTDGG